MIPRRHLQTNNKVCLTVIFKILIVKLNFYGERLRITRLLLFNSLLNNMGNEDLKWVLLSISSNKI